MRHLLPGGAGPHRQGDIRPQDARDPPACKLQFPNFFKLMMSTGYSDWFIPFFRFWIHR